VTGSGLGGAHLHLHAPPLAEAEIRSGSLLDERVETAGPADLRAPLRRPDPGDAPAGRPAGGALLRGRVRPCLEIVIGAAWSEARAGQATDELPALDAATRGIAGDAGSGSGPAADHGPRPRAGPRPVRRPRIVDQEGASSASLRAASVAPSARGSARRRTATACSASSVAANHPAARPRHRHGPAPLRVPC